jgi:hypothetical protein
MLDNGNLEKMVASLRRMTGHLELTKHLAKTGVPTATRSSLSKAVPY